MAGVVAVRRPVEVVVALPMDAAKLKWTVPVVPTGGRSVEVPLGAAVAAEAAIVVADPSG